MDIPNPMARNKKTPKAGTIKPGRSSRPPAGANVDAWHVGRLIQAGNAMALMLADSARPSTEARICAIGDWQIVSADALK
jgi:hypothetical protein